MDHLPLYHYPKASHWRRIHILSNRHSVGSMRCFRLIAPSRYSCTYFLQRSAAPSTVRFVRRR